MTVLVARSIEYYSQLDEEAFFQWIKRIACVRETSGRGLELLIEVDDQVMDDACLRDLLAIFHRYRIDSKSLSIFLSEKNSAWFASPNMYWYESVFG